jgi:hypothetical protein
METSKPLEKRPVGKPLTVDARHNKQYFVDYYHRKNAPMVCECGQSISKFYYLKHIKLKKHQTLLERKSQPP